MEPNETATIEAGLKQQLEALYEQRARLHAELGTADAGDVLAMIESLKQQLEALYEARQREFETR